MSNIQNDISESQFLKQKPIFEDDADSIMAFLDSISPIQISTRLGISNKLAIKAKSLALEFPIKNLGYEALFGFTGEAFKGLQASTLSSDAIENAYNNLKFISSVYGLLNASDIIKPYRCEFNKPFLPDNKSSIQFYKQKITISLVNLIKENKIKDIINLLPGDADKCIDWKVVRAFTKVHKICFQQITSDGTLRTPIAKRLKELRGIMARTILSQNIRDFKALTQVKSDYFIFSPHDSKPLLPIFICE